MSEFGVGSRVKFSGGVAFLGNNQGILVERFDDGEEVEWFLKQDLTGDIVCRFQSELELVKEREE